MEDVDEPAARARRLMDGLALIKPSGIFASEMSLSGPTFDFSGKNMELSEALRCGPAAFTEFCSAKVAHPDGIAIGSYNEDRVIYKRAAALFEASGDVQDERTIHLGVDLFAAAGSAVFAPIEGTVHSFKVHHKA